jgi:hypothetical protein
MACVGGPGRVEEGPIPLYCREAPLNWIWEGLGKACVVTRLASESGRVAEPWPDRLDRAAILAGVAA